MSIRSFASDTARVAKFSDIHPRFAPDRNVNVELDRSLSPTVRLAVCVIMVGQNLQGRYGELVASANVSQRTEAEVEAILQHLTNQSALMLEILRRVESLEARGPSH